MFINDEKRLQELAIRKSDEDQKQKVLDYALLTERFAVKVKSEDDTSIYEKQLGSKLTPAEFETKLKKINPNFIFRSFNNKKGELIRGLCLPVVPYADAYSVDIIPEFSVLTLKREVVQDPSALRADFVLNRKDLPKGKWVQYDNGDGTITAGWEFESDVFPGMKVQNTQWHEKIRGWRTLLSRMIIRGILNVTEVEKEFGAADRKSWAVRTGRFDEALSF